MTKILLLDDDTNLAETVSNGLTAMGFAVERSVDGDEALFRLRTYHYDLAILDWSVPGLTGVKVCQEFRGLGGHIPIIMLTGKQDVENKEEAFDIGADDYLTKPFSFRELAARVKALLRRPPVAEKQEIAIGSAVMNVENKILKVNGAVVDISAAEFALLELFMKSPEHVFSSDELLNKLYASDSESTSEAVRQRIFRLRKILDGTEIGIKTVTGSGYRLESK